MERPNTDLPNYVPRHCSSFHRTEANQTLPEQGDGHTAGEGSLLARLGQETGIQVDFVSHPSKNPSLEV